MIYSSLAQSFRTAVLKNKYGHEVIKTLNIEATAPKVLWNSTLARFVKLQGKTSIVEFNFIKVVDQKFWCWNSYETTERVDGNEVKGCSKIKVYGLNLWLA